MLQGLFQQPDIMSIRAGKNNSQRNTFLIGQYTAFCPHFFPDPLDFFQRLPMPAELLPYSRPDSAIPSRSFPVLLPKSSQKNQQPTSLQHIKYSFQCFSRRHRFASLSGRTLIYFFFGSRSFFLRNFILDCFPKFI